MGTSMQQIFYFLPLSEKTSAQLPGLQCDLTYSKQMLYFTFSLSTHADPTRSFIQMGCQGVGVSHNTGHNVLLYSNNIHCRKSFVTREEHLKTLIPIL